MPIIGDGHDSPSPLILLSCRCRCSGGVRYIVLHCRDIVLGSGGVEVSGHVGCCVW